MKIMLTSIMMIMMRVFVDIYMVLDDWCYIRMMWNVVWQSTPFQIVKPEFFIFRLIKDFLFRQMAPTPNFSYLIHSDKIPEKNRDFVRKILIASTICHNQLQSWNIGF